MAQVVQLNHEQATILLSVSYGKQQLTAPAFANSVNVACLTVPLLCDSYRAEVPWYDMGSAVY